MCVWGGGVMTHEEEQFVELEAAAGRSASLLDRRDVVCWGLKLNHEPFWGKKHSFSFLLRV